jgi:hypothetical protein
LIEESKLLRRLIFVVGIWPKRKCQRSEATIHDSTNELEGKPIKLGSISVFA